MTGSNDIKNESQETNKDFVMKEISLLKERMKLIENRCQTLEAYVKQLREHHLPRELPVRMMVQPNSLAPVNASLPSTSRQQQNLQRPHERLPLSIVAPEPSSRSPPPKYSEQLLQSTASHEAQSPVLRPSRKNRRGRWDHGDWNKEIHIHTSRNGNLHIFHQRGGRGRNNGNVYNFYY
ncbi:hypothetical protein PV328_004235 [Microctonus aethiopoides]|nr:hypothetical protein PV328_004235 [Microctonus aethiopoides]